MSADPEAWSGELIGHSSPCPRKMQPRQTQCFTCDWTKHDNVPHDEAWIHWATWESHDVGECAECGATDRYVFDEHTGVCNEPGVCLPCYVARHKELCGCDLWRFAEKAMKP